MPTLIAIDAEILQTAMDVSGIRTEKGVVEQALREFVERRTRKNLRDLRGRIHFADGYDHTAHRKGT